MIPKIQTIQVNNNDVSPKRVNVGTRGSYGVTKLNFELSSEWDGSACEVVFHPRRGKPISVVWAGVPIDVPVEIMEHNGIAGYVFSGIQRSSYDTDESVKRVSLPGELEVLFTLEDKGGNSKGFTPSMYSQILALIGDLGSLTTDARENLVAAINEAAQSGSGDIDEDTVREIITNYLKENPIEGTKFTTDNTLTLKNGVLSVNTAKEVSDNTLPITAAAVNVAVGNIEVLLKTI